MTYQPVVIGSGIMGWRFIERTYDAQFEAFSKSPSFERDTDYFKENISTIKSAEDLVSDRRLLRVALSAFGLKDDLNNRYFIQKILEDGTTANSALANRLADDRYSKFSQAFGFGPGETIKTGNSFEMSGVLDRHKAQEFEIAVGNVDETMRIALSAQHELVNLANSGKGEDAMWFNVMGTPPLRSFFETALGLPKFFGRIDIDRQLVVFQDRMDQLTGKSSVAQFQRVEFLEKITNAFLARSQIGNLGAGNSASSNAVLLLQAAIH